jgi:hypothetical protein
VDQFDTSTQVAGDRDNAKISILNNLNKAQIGNFREILHLIGCGRRPHEPKFAKQGKNFHFYSSFHHNMENSFFSLEWHTTVRPN